MKPLGQIKRSIQLFWLVVGFALVAGVGVLDVLTGYELSVSLFYLLPVSVVTWFGGRRYGIVASVVSAFVWFAADLFSGHPYPHPVILYWNTAIRFGFFLSTTLLLSALQQALEHEQQLARIDNLTGAVNQRFFTELLQRELDRSQRFKHPLTVAYVDLDNFKMVNDSMGHSIGDKVLTTTVRNARGVLRKTDVVARIGGDEFAVLLPQTDEAAAHTALNKLRLSLLDEMRKNNWPVTFSIGVLTCIKMPSTTDELLKQADALMYSVKNAGKNAVTYSVYAD